MAYPEEVEPGWFNYEFQTDLDCPNRCGPGVHPLYIGKSNDSLRRLLEHAKTQAWFKYVTGWKIHRERYATERESLDAETRRIRVLRPLANDRDNRDNPCRMDFGTVAVPRRTAARRGKPEVTRRVIPLRRWPTGGTAGKVAVALSVSIGGGWLAACLLLHVAVVAGLVGSSGSVCAMALLVWAWLLPKRSGWRPLARWAALFVGFAGLWGLAGMPADAPLPALPPGHVAPVSVPSR
jgi:hypothetical protein